MNLHRFATIVAEENKPAKVMGLADLQFGRCELITGNTHHQHLTDIDVEFFHVPKCSIRWTIFDRLCYIPRLV